MPWIWCMIAAIAGLAAYGCQHEGTRGLMNSPQGDTAVTSPGRQPKPPFLFREAPLPDGFPPAGPVGQVVLKSYPSYRFARVRTADGGGGDPNDMFRPLFQHIQRHEIAMTAPVEIKYAATLGDEAAAEPLDQHEPRAQAMAFLYREPSLGRVGPDPADPRVEVADLPSMMVLSVGVRGGYTARNLSHGLRQIEAWLKQNPPRFKVAGSPRYLAYNSPFVPGFLKFGEVQVPVEVIDEQAPAPAR